MRYAAHREVQRLVRIAGGIRQRWLEPGEHQVAA
jgi:hypothetical protein